MATLAELFASSQAPNVNQLPTQPVAFQRPGGFNKTFGTIMDVLAAMGGKAPGYSTGIASRENAYNQSMKQQQFQNVFRNFVENPDDPATLANLAYQDPEAFMKVAPQNKVVGSSVVRMGAFGKPEVTLAGAGSEGSQPREVMIAKMLADPNVAPEVKSRLESMVAPKPTRERLVATAQGYLPESQAVGMMPYRAPERASSGSGGSAGPQFLSPDQKQNFGLDPDLPWIIDNKGNPRLPTGFKAPTGQRGAVAPEEVISTIQRARTLLPAASPGGLAGAATKAGEFVGMSTGRSKADAALRVIAGKLTASVPRFEGPQALPEVKLYQAMAADVANSDLPVQSRLAALSEMEALVRRNQQVKAQRRPGAAPAQGGGKTIRFDAQGRRIP